MSNVLGQAGELFRKVRVERLTGGTVVFLAITPSGLVEALREAERSGAAVWCGSDALSELDFAALGGKRLTRFAYALGPRDPMVLEGALDTIGQHHPSEVVWVEAAASVC